MTICPTCAQRVTLATGLDLRGSVLFSNAGCLRLGPVATAIVRSLLAGPLTTEQLVERVYGAAADAPEDPSDAINTTVAKLRRRWLPEIGWTIVNPYGTGRGGAVYRLAETDSERMAA